MDLARATNNPEQVARAVFTAMRDHAEGRGSYYNGSETALYLRIRVALREYDERKDSK